MRSREQRHRTHGRLSWRVVALFALAGAAANVLGCAGSLAAQRRLDAERESALKLVDESRALEKAGSPILALERLNRSVAIHQTPIAWNRQGQVFEALGKEPQAAAAYAQALKLAPDYQEARLALLAIGRVPPGPAPTPQELAQAAARRVERDRFLAQKASKAGQSAATVAGPSQETLDEAAQRRLPTQAEVQAAIFAPDARRGELPSADKAISKSNDEIILGTYDYHLRKARRMLRSDPPAAEEEYLRALEADPAQIDARLELGDLLQKEEHSERALYQYDRAMTDFPDSPRPLHRLGVYYDDLKRPDLARRYYKLAIQKDPNFMEAYNNLAVLDMKEGKFASARKTLDEVIRRDPTFANAYLNRGIIASDIDKDRQRALDDFNRYVGLNGPRSAEARRWIRELQSQPN